LRLRARARLASRARAEAVTTCPDRQACRCAGWPPAAPWRSKRVCSWPVRRPARWQFERSPPPRPETVVWKC
jgi:hypothetical protein